VKGIVFNLLDELVRRHHGEDAWDAILDGAGAVGAYTSLGSYEDAELGRLVESASTVLGESPHAILIWFGRKAIPELVGRFPQFFSPHRRTEDFLLTLNEIIHPEVMKLYPGASTPVFDFDRSNRSVLRMGYVSERKLCSLAQGFVEGAAEHFGDDCEIAEPECMVRGDSRCLFEIRLSSAQVV